LVHSRKLTTREALGPRKIHDPRITAEIVESSGAFDGRGKTIAIVLSGGNIDPDMLVRCLDSARP
jgi:hypothetical protein